MGRFLLILLFITSAHLTWAAPLSVAPLCSGEKPSSTPFFRVRLSPAAFEDQVEKILNSQLGDIEDSVTQLDLQDQIIGTNRPACTKYRDEPGMDHQSMCLYLPKIIFGEEVMLRDFKNDIKQSIGFKLNFDNVRIPSFVLEKPQMKCDFSNGQTICDIQVDIKTLEIESQFELVDPRERQRVFSTVSPLRASLNAQGQVIPRISLKAILNENGKADEAIEIVKDSMRLHIPEGSLSSNIQNNPEDIVNRAKEILESRLSADLSEEEQARAMLKMLESEETNKLIEQLAISYSVLSLAKDFVGDVDILAQFQKPILEMVDEPLSIILTGIIEGVLPFGKSTEVTLPFMPTQDTRDGLLYFDYFQEVAEYLDLIEEEFQQAANYRKAKPLRRKHATQIKKISYFAQRIRSSHIEELGDEIKILNFRLQTHLQILESTDKVSRSLRKVLLKAIHAVSVTTEALDDLELPSYRKSQLHIDRVGRVGPKGIEVLVSGCHIGGLAPDAPPDWEKSEINRPILKESNFAFEIPVDIVNQHLKLLSDNSFFNYCIGKKGRSCAENKSSKTDFKFDRPPQIKIRNEQYVLEVPELERTVYTALPDFIDKAFLRDNSRIKICVDNLVVDFKTGKIIPNGCINAGVNIEKNFRFEHLLSLWNPWSAFFVFGIKFTHSAAQGATLDHMENRSMATTIDDLLLRNGEYAVTELRVNNGLVSIFGQVVPKSEQQ